MRAAAWVCAVLSAAPILASERMNVSVCPLGRLRDSAVVGAEAAAAGLFHSMDIDIVWARCDAGPVGEEATRQHWFTIRLRDDRPPGAPTSASLDTLGEAFFSDDQAGYLAEVYYRAGQDLASSEQMAPSALLGCVMAHELGHLLLGPGHAPGGIMRAGWNATDLDAIRRGSLKFNAAESARIRQKLQDSQ
jgi:hypothetical protein